MNNITQFCNASGERFEHKITKDILLISHYDLSINIYYIRLHVLFQEHFLLSVYDVTITLTEILLRGTEIHRYKIQKIYAVKRRITRDNVNKKDNYDDNATKWDFMGSMG